MALNGLHNELYLPGAELGRGGEGVVYELRSHSGMVLKKYTDPLTPERIAKLHLMAAMSSKELQQYAAWPADVVTDTTTGQVCGFVMRKLAGYVPLHMIFSPMDRKRMFPDKGYNFLVHVARNIATAFHRLHGAGLVAGDVNEGNILISSSGMAAFIDCDSFQVKSDTGYYYCEVGVPRYTPPELLAQATFSNVVRTADTDAFSLAVLIFQLLFLGRHPFAGRNRSAADIDEETAIRQREFAYSVVNKRKKLLPPADSFDINNLPESIIYLFHRAFEQEGRPTPAEWIKALDALLADMVTCSAARLHSYPAQMKECPWCASKKKRGILYFLDDSYLHANPVLGDVESFVNGFRVEQLELKKWNGQMVFPALKPSAIHSKFVKNKSARFKTNVVLLIMAVGLAILHPLLFLLVLPFFYYINWRSGWVMAVKAEISKRDSAYKHMRMSLENAINEYNKPADFANYTRGLAALHNAVHQFRNLPEAYERKKKDMEQLLYNGQLNGYLSQFVLADYTIPAIGNAKKSTLQQYGIADAAAIGSLATTKVPGIGPKNIQILMDWQRQMASGFVYIPKTDHIAAGMHEVEQDIAALKNKLAADIRHEYQALSYLKLNITNRAAILEKHISDMAMNTYQAEIDLMAYRKFAA